MSIKLCLFLNPPLEDPVDIAVLGAADECGAAVNGGGVAVDGACFSVVWTSPVVVGGVGVFAVVGAVVAA